MTNVENLPKSADAYNQAKRFVDRIEPCVFYTRDTMFPLIVFALFDSKRIESFSKVGSWKLQVSELLRSIWDVSDAQLHLICDSIEKTDRDMIFFLFDEQIISLSDSCKYSVSEHAVASFLAKLDILDCWNIFKQWCESGVLIQAAWGLSTSEKPVLTISCGDIAVAFITEDTLLSRMRELFSADSADPNQNPITDYLRTLSYDHIQMLLKQSPVTIDLSPKG